MSEWKDVDDAAKDGSHVWIAAKLFHPGIDRKFLKEEKFRIVMLCRYSTWDHKFKQVPDGKLVDLPDFLPLDLKYQPANKPTWDIDTPPPSE